MSSAPVAVILEKTAVTFAGSTRYLMKVWSFNNPCCALHVSLLALCEPEHPAGRDVLLEAQVVFAGPDPVPAPGTASLAAQRGAGCPIPGCHRHPL